MIRSGEFLSRLFGPALKIGPKLLFYVSYICEGTIKTTPLRSRLKFEPK